jgi:hypothetical protein
MREMIEKLCIRTGVSTPVRCQNASTAQLPENSRSRRPSQELPAKHQHPDPHLRR